jgi:tetratricopeptide (TPR) repeat protein
MRTPSRFTNAPSRSGKKVLQPDDSELATSLDNLAVVYASQQKFALAEPLYRRSLAIREKADVDSMNNLALALEGKGENAAAERLYQRALTMVERIPSLPGNANVGESAALLKTLGNYSLLLRKLKRDSEAAKLETRAKAISLGASK